MGLTTLFPSILALAAVASAFPHIPRSSRLVSLPARRVPLSTGGNIISKRKDATAILDDITYGYLINLDLGTPGQPVEVVLDTGSDQFWVNPDCSTSPLTQQADCAKTGTYSLSDSSTGHNLGAPFKQVYGIGSASGTFVTDKVAITGTDTVLQNVQFAMATTTTDVGLGILGVGFGSNLNYTNFIDDLVLQNVTSTRAFSLALGTAKTAQNDSTVIFGGVDTQKFSGPLVTVPNLGPQEIDLSPVTGKSAKRYWVQLNSITTGGQTISNSSMPVVLDSGSTVHILPKSLVKDLAARLGGDGTSYAGQLWSVPCSAGQSTATLDYAFGDAIIRVPLNDSVVASTEPGVCVLGAIGTDESEGIPPVLGQPLLHSAYVVFDQDHMQISLAQYINCGTHEQPMTADGGAHFVGDCAAPAVPKSGAGRPVLGLAAVSGLVALVAALNTL